MQVQDDSPQFVIARAVVLKGQSIAVHKRLAHGFPYFSFPGGHIEPGETAQQAVRREVSEELSLEVVVKQELYYYVSKTWGNQVFFLCDYQSGEISLDPNSAEAADNAQGDNTYQPQWIPVSELTTIDLLPEAIKTQLLIDIQHGQFANEAVKIYDESVKESGN